jgi:hypothetical protein
MNKYQIRRKAEAKQLSVELEAICVALSGNWHVDYNHDTDWDYAIPWSLQDDTGRTLHVTAIWNHPDRIEVQGCGWPEYIDSDGKKVRTSPRDFGQTYDNGKFTPRESVPVSTFARSRPVSAIAKQIESKVLPEYDRLMARLAEKANSSQVYANKAQKAARDIAIACGEEYKPGHNTHYVRNMSGDTLRVEYRSPGSCIIDLPASEMVEVIGLVRKLRASKAA